mmetsp:Transcript_11325/g.18954  ORF Transcript_11325/g.18954 Transcript_11325/m.18954 type:complete len:440 (+) Transcript_11325:138-1457(+)|eukprot:CAMPEP_0119339592 /NCGR_PEP_ID=MMETSP1333-20130426/98571_1 /TAXON_ID=418940 /ORGANISM="Scyphosphaera apsteinii, Strain RCC1455" /LENGTH=439 /DNA_ID=CAMNT_0007351137 /DNA_START=138 /DNA_END=1457 /DNA_ORIENTATION=-
MSRPTRTSVHATLKRSSTGSTLLAVNQYKLGTLLGAGAFGTVYRAINSKPSAFDKVVAIKVLRRSLLRRKRIGQHGSALESVAREIAVMKKLEHPNCVKLFEVIDDPQHDELFLVMEFLEGGELSNMTRERPLSEEVARSVVFDVCVGLAYLHSQGIVHRDIKPSNMLLWQPVTSGGKRFSCLRSLLRHSARTSELSDSAHRRMRIKLCDFGVATICDATKDEEECKEGSLKVMGATGGSYAFFAPEMCEAGPYNGVKADMWAMGVSLFLILFGQLPFEAETPHLLLNAIRKEEVRWPHIPTLSSDALDLLRMLLHKDPDQRASLHEARSHPWLTEYGFEMRPENAQRSTDPNKAEIDNALNLRNDIGCLPPSYVSPAAVLPSFAERTAHRRKSATNLMFDSLGVIGMLSTSWSRTSKPSHSTNAEVQSNCEYSSALEA